MKKQFCFILMSILLLSVFLSPVAFAATKSNLYVDRASSGISITSDGYVRVDFGTWGTGTMTTVGAEKIELYKDGGLVKVFYSSNASYTSSMLGYGVSHFYGYVTFQAAAGSSYHAVVKHYAANSSGSGTETTTTPYITYTGP